MIYSLKGKLVYADLNSAVIDVNGIAFRCYTSVTTLKKIGNIGSEVMLYTYLNVREDAMELYGFYDDNELNCFKMLLSVSGIGPKAASNILSALSPENLALAIASNDARSIQTAQGIGKKGAERIVLELKDKITALDLSSNTEILEEVTAAAESSSTKDAVSALVSLGYSQSEAAQILSKVDKSLSTEDMIKFALKQLM